MACCVFNLMNLLDIKNLPHDLLNSFANPRLLLVPIMDSPFILLKIEKY